MHSHSFSKAGRLFLSQVGKLYKFRNSGVTAEHETKSLDTNVSSGCENEKETKVKSACYSLYITASVADMLELETTVLHVPDPMVGYICTATMVAIPLFLIHLYHEDTNYVHPPSFCNNAIL
jgi:hypothetical protein